MPRTKTKPPKAKVDEFGLPQFIAVDALVLIVGIKERRLNQLITDARLPPEVKKGAPPGYWNTGKAITEILGYYRRQADKSKPTYDLEIERQTRLEDLRSLRIKNAKSSKDLLPHPIVAQVWGEILSVFKNRFLAYSGKMGPLAFRAKDKVEAAEILDSEIRDIFSGLPALIEGVSDRITGDEFSDDGEATGTDGPAKKPADLVPEKP